MYITRDSNKITNYDISKTLFNFKKWHSGFFFNITKLTCNEICRLLKLPLTHKDVAVQLYRVDYYKYKTRHHDSLCTQGAARSLVST